MKKQAEEQKKIFNRLEALYQKNLISQEEYEISKGNADLNQINISIAEAHLQTVQSGVKKDQIDYINSQIQSLQKQIDILQKRFKNYTLISQVTGIANRVLGNDTLLIVSDTSEFVVLIPVKWEERNYLSKNQTVNLKYPDSFVTQDATLVRIDKSIHPLNGGQVFLVTAYFDSPKIDFLSGLMVQCSIQCDPIRPVDYIERIFQSILR
jgi:ATP-dependent 26S proteasome regulatory subunit